MEFVYVTDWRTFPSHEAQIEEIFCKAFAERGHTVHFCFGVNSITEPYQRTSWHGHPVHLFRRGAGMYGRLALYLGRALAEDGIEFVQVRNDPAFALIAKVLAGLRRKPFVFHLTILNGEGLIDAAQFRHGLIKLKLLVKGRIGARLVEYIALTADLLLPISDAMAAYYAGRGRGKPTIALPMGFAASHLVAAALPSPRDSRLTRVLYIGALDRQRHIEFLLQAIALAGAEVPGIHLTLLGSALNATDLEYVVAVADELKLTERGSITILPPVTRQQVVPYILGSDIGVSPIPPTVCYSLSSPTKLMEFLGNGLPVVANDIPEQQRIIAESHAGICTPYDVRAFADGIITLARDVDGRREMGRRGAEFMGRTREYKILAENAEAAYRLHASR